MTIRRSAPLALAAVVAVGAFVPAHAKKPTTHTISKSYTVNATPFPYPPSGPACSGGTEGTTKHSETLKAPAAGKLHVEISGFTGDWDGSVTNPAGETLAESTGSSTPNTSPAPPVDTIDLKVKKPQTLIIVVCNFVGTPSAKAKYVYTYVK